MSFVYLIEAENGLVKIGHSCSPESRANTISLHSPILTRLIAFWPAPRQEETDLHIRYASHRNHREWFRAEGALAAFVEARRGEGVESIPDWDDIRAPDGITIKDRVSALISEKVRAAHRRPETRRKHAIQAMANGRRRREVKAGVPSMDYAGYFQWAEAEYEARHPQRSASPDDAAMAPAAE